MWKMLDGPYQAHSEFCPSCTLVSVTLGGEAPDGSLEEAMQEAGLGVLRAELVQSTLQP